MNFKAFKDTYQKAPVIEYTNNSKNSSALLTVKLITYNHANYIVQCLDSILMQKTDFDFEILIAEDDSNDGTREICKKYADKYPDKIRLLLNSRKNNIPIQGKPSGTFNSAYANYCIDSKYIAFIEGDDYWTDTKNLQKKVSFLEENEDYVVCFSEAVKYIQSTHKIKKTSSFYKKTLTIPKGKLLNAKIYNLTKVYKNVVKDIFEDNMTNILCGDRLLNGRLTCKGKSRFIKDIAPAVYRVHNKGAFSMLPYEDRYRAIIKVNKILLTEYRNKNIDTNYIKKSIIKLYLKLFIKNLVRLRF